MKYWPIISALAAAVTVMVMLSGCAGGVPDSMIKEIDGVELHDAAETLKIDDVGLRSLTIPRSNLEWLFGPREEASRH